MNNDNSILRLRVFNHLENAILDGKYKDNESLNELKISQELNVSRKDGSPALINALQTTIASAIVTASNTQDKKYLQ